MYLIQIFLPLYSNTGKKFPKEIYAKIRETLVDRYGGLTIYNRSPVKGLWKINDKETAQDEILIFEIMSRKLSKIWWRNYRLLLQRTFAQKSLVVRVHPFQLL